MIPTDGVPATTATALAAQIRSGRRTSAAVTEELLDRLHRLDPVLRAFVTVDAEGARRQAIAADAARSAGQDLGPLHGVPVTVKDSFAVVGLPTTAGLVERQATVGLADAPAVARLRAAGAVVLGLTATPVLCGDIQTHNPIVGRTANPWDPDRTAGGSSGGSAAAVAAGLGPISLASDLSGSIRIPAAWCGVAGLKPSHGLVSKRGHLPEGAGAYPVADVSVAGPIARSVADLELALDVLAGPEPELAAAWQVRLPPARATDPRQLRVEVWLDDDRCPVAEDVAAAVRRAAALLDRAGAQVAVRPVPGGLSRWVEVFRAVTQGEIVGNTPLDPGVAGLLSHQRWAADETERQALQAELGERFSSIDVVLCPVVPVAAIPHDTDRPPAERRIDVDGRDEPYERLDRWCSIATVGKGPAVVVPVGRTSSGLPLAVQVLGPLLEDRTALAAAAMVERLLAAPPG